MKNRIICKGRTLWYNDGMNNTTVGHAMVTTAFELNQYRIVKNLGATRGIIVRSRNIFGSIGAGIQTLFGGNISLYTGLCEKTRADAFDLMCAHATDMGANAIVGFRYDAHRNYGGVNGSPRVRHRCRRGTETVA